jgi:hypothetical protein
MRGDGYRVSAVSFTTLLPGDITAAAVAAIVSICEAAWNNRCATSVSPWRRLLDAMLRVAFACITQSVSVNMSAPSNIWVDLMQHFTLTSVLGRLRETLPVLS